MVVVASVIVKVNELEAMVVLASKVIVSFNSSKSMLSEATAPNPEIVPDTVRLPDRVELPLTVRVLVAKVSGLDVMGPMPWEVGGNWKVVGTILWNDVKSLERLDSNVETLLILCSRVRMDAMSVPWGTSSLMTMVSLDCGVCGIN